ncbi:MAG: lamin tail domain-containing protein [Phycisphaerales bacterium]
MLTMLLAVSVAAGSAKPEPAKTEPLKVTPPHPVITEVLYAVPTGDGGDANKDGSRNAAGDEFIELVNPHDKPISLKGYKITDKSLGKAGALVFIFPECELKPGAVVVIFNGFEANVPGACGDTAKAPAGSNEKFSGAIVFSIKVTSNRLGFSNTSDCVVLSSPDGKAVEIVKWGAISETLPECPLVEDAPTTNKASVTRRGMTKGFVVHDTLGGNAIFSPGKFDVKVTTSAPTDEKKDEPKPADKTPTKPDPKKPADTKPKAPKP